MIAYADKDMVIVYPSIAWAKLLLIDGCRT